ncbi:MAG TPA: HAMP domain-containing sensor histidine kinase [Actinopolymorphaceae bacterium]
MTTAGSDRPVVTPSLRRRVVVAVLALLLVVLLGLGLLVNAVLGERLRSDLRQRLVDRADYAQLLDTEGLSGQTLTDRLTGAGITTSFVSTGGDVTVGREAPVAPGAGGPGVGGPGPGGPRGRPSHNPASPGFDVTRQGNRLTVQLPISGGTLTLQASDADVSHTLGILRNTEIVAGLAMLLVTGLILIRVVGVALAPLDRMTTLAQRIRDGARGRRLRPTRPDTDLGRTAVAFDGMLDALESAESQALAAEDRMRQFLADASHDLRTPLAAMIAGAERILRENPARADRETQLVQVVRDGQRAARLVDDLLFMARLDVGPQRPAAQDSLARVDIGALAVAAAAALRLQRPDLDVHVDDQTDGTTVVGDPDELRRALTNLLDNAGTATPAGGAVGVRASLDAGRVIVSVQDSGPGVPESERARIFDRFVRGDDARSSDGSGLGLPIARTIARRLGGDVVLAPSGRGARFDLWLPAAVRIAAAGYPAERVDTTVSSVRSG